MTTAKPRGGKEGKPAETPPARERLIQAATAAFSRSGYQGARVDEIARKADINKQLVFHYFGNKDGLYTAVLERAYLKFRGDDRILKAVSEEPDPEVALKKIATYLYSRSAANNEFQRLIQDLNVQTNHRHLKSLAGVRDAYERLLEAIAEILERGAKSGQFRPNVDPRQFYISLAGVYSVRVSNAATLSFMLGVDLNSKDGIQASQEEAFNLLLNGIAARKVADSGAG